jgi:hypothetical protein
MANQVASPVDGVVVVQDPDQRMTWWAMDQLYLGAEGRNKYVGKVGDYVIDRSIPWQPKVYVITAISKLLIATFRLVSFYANSEENELTSFVGVGPGQINNNTRIYINKETMPYTLHRSKTENRLFLSNSSFPFSFPFFFFTKIT